LTGVRLAGSTGLGLLGTGAFLLGTRRIEESRYEGAVWWTALFLPLVPRRRLTLRCAEAGLDAPGFASRTFTLEVEGERAQTGREIGLTYARALLGAVVTLAPAAYTFARIHETSVVAAIRLVVSALIPMAVAAYLDHHRVRVGKSRAS